jgi:aspartate beta-hydroxylase
VLEIGRREELRAVIGSKAERLVYLFCTLPRRTFFDSLFACSSIPTQGLTLPVEMAGKQSDLCLDPSEVFALAVVHMANEAEQSCLDDGKPGIWLTHVSMLASQLRKAQGRFPPVFDNCSMLIGSDDEVRLRECYGNGFDVAPSDRAAADTHFARCSEICPWVAEPLILRAYLKILEGNVAGAAELSLRATTVLDQWRTAWDKRLSWGEWKHLAGVLSNPIESERLSRLAPEFIREPRTLFNRVASRPRTQTLSSFKPMPEPRTMPSDNGSGGGVASTRLEHYISSFADPKADPRRALYPELPSAPWHDPKGFPIVSALEGAYQQINQEIIRLQDEDFHVEAEKLARKGAWEVFFFYERGKKNLENCSRCPTITAIIEQHETVRSLAGLIYASRMRPGTHIAPHRGPTNLRVRCHLGIQVPDGDCGLRVGDEIGSWSEGRCIVFDDYYEHEAWNYTSKDRIVLIVDLWHPALTTHEREILKSLHRYAFVHAESLQAYWTANMKAKAAHAYH